MHVLMVCGSRRVCDVANVKRVVDSVLVVHNVSKIIHGGCRGVDSVCWSYSDNYAVEMCSADWRRYGKAAGIIRNKKLVEAADVVLCIFEDVNNKSAGTNFSCEYSLAHNKIVYIYDMKQNKFIIA